MKPITIITTCAALLAASAGSWAQTPDDGRKFGNGVLPEYLAMYDADNSGDLSMDEMWELNQDRNNPNRHSKFRQQWDTDKDGRVDSNEQSAARIEIRNRITQRRSDRFDAVDTGVNNAGTLEGAQDGALSLAEFSRIKAVEAAELANTGTATRLFNFLDKDNNGLISRAEFLQSLNSVRPSSPTDAPVPKPHPANNLNGGNGN
jgi:Ca2+-binding EF-hand superfamily protein